MKLKTILAALLLLTALIHADPAPFGLEIGKASVADVKAKYSTTYTGINKYSNGDVYDLDVSELSLDGLESATVIFGADGKLQGVFCSLPKEKFRYLFGSLKSKYKLINSNIPFVGDSSAKFMDGNTEITLNAPHMSFKMDMAYIDKNLVKKFKQQSSNEQQNKKKKEAAQL